MNTLSNSYFGKTLTICLPLLSAALSLSAATTLYVNINNTNPVPPFTDWATAAANIQDAVDAAAAGDEIVVTNGVYQTGVRAVYGMSNRVAVTIPVTVRSVNGPEVTTIVGYQVPGTTNGPAAVRCVYLASGAALAGFTLINGGTQTSGDSWTNQSGGGVWCAGLNSVVSNCVLAGNSAARGGGGSWFGTLYNCAFTGNSGYAGGGAYGGTLTNCMLMGNSATFGGGGSYSGTLNNCALTGNSAGGGGGACDGTLNNCTLTGNSADYGGGVNGGTLNNCIVYYNSARRAGTNYYYYANSTFTYSCTTPLPVGTGNFADEPQLASTAHLSSNSPCIGRGRAAFARGVDVDGEPWANPPSIGCDEYWSGSVTGALSVAVVAAYTNVALGFAVDFQAVVGGRVSASRWDFGDGVVVSNRALASHGWAAAGEYVVELRAYNKSNPAGVAATVMMHVVQEEHYVVLTSANPVPPYSSWATAARNIQDAVDAAGPGALVWVSNGVYQTGARAVYGMSNRVAVTKPVTVQSVNGPTATHIVGSGPIGSAAVRCVYLTNGAVLAGFTLTNGATQTSGDYLRNLSGGGVWCEGLSAVVSNCVLTRNSAYNEGGGAYFGTLNNSTLAGNSASFGDGGGAYDGTLNNCTLTGNYSADSGGAAAWSTLNNCLLTGNSASDRGGGVFSATLNNCALTGNSANYGGGANSGTLRNCTFTGNSAKYDGGGAYAATLNICRLTGNSANYGGGAFGSTLTNCTLRGNSSGLLGGGANSGTLINCTLTLNSAGQGGGAFYGTLINCTLTGNSAIFGGGACSNTLFNCIVYNNSASSGGANYFGSMFYYSCTTPLPSQGTSNLANEPSLVNTNGWSNLRLQTSSPCINAGNNAYATGPSDLDGRPRIVGGAVDMGAYEYQGPGMGEFIGWVQQYGLPTDGSADFADPDGDRANNWQEWQCATVPTNALSALRLLTPQTVGTNLVVSWQSVSGKSYFLERSTGLGTNASFLPLATNLAGQAGTTTFTDTNVAPAGPRFYRVGVQ